MGDAHSAHTNVEPLTDLSWANVAPEEKRRRQKLLEPRPWDGKVKKELSVKAFGCQLELITLNIRSTQRQISDWTFTAKLFVPLEGKSTAKKSVVFVLPTIERETLLEQTLMKTLCKNQIATLLIDSIDNQQPRQLPAWDHENQVMIRTLNIIKTFLSWAHAETRFKKNPALLGESLGAITALLVAGVEPRFKSVVTVVGAGNMPLILKESTYPRVALLRVRRLASSQMKRDEYELQMRKSFLFDPLVFRDNIRPEKLFMVQARWDTMVPFEAQEQTWKLFGEPKRIVLPWSGHLDALARVAFSDLEEIIEFIK